MAHQADADAGDRVAAPGDQPDLLGAEADLLGDYERADDLGLGQEHDELVAAISVGGVDGSNRAVDDGAEGAQHLVPAEVAGAVVDRLEPVDVDHQHAEAAVAAPGAADLLLEGQEQLRAVEEPGERIGPREVDHPLHRPSLVPGIGDRHERQQPGRQQADGEAQDVLRAVQPEVRVDRQHRGKGKGGERCGGDPGTRAVGQRGRHADERKQHRER